MCIKPIHNEQDYNDAIHRIEKLWNCTPKDTYLHDQLEILGSLASYYQQDKWPSQYPDPIEALKFYIDLKEIKPHELMAVLGGLKKTNEILSKERPLTLQDVWILCKKWGLPAETLIKPYRLQLKNTGKSTQT